LVKTDSFQRNIDFLRLSITDRCNERCLYCLPEGFTHWKTRAEILTYEEILDIVQLTVSLGIPHYRVTGGEPLVRQDVELFIRDLSVLPGVESVGLSTNGARLAGLAGALARAGLRSANVSLDAIDPHTYQRLTGGKVKDVIQGIDAARAAGIDQIKLNTVLMRGVNESQIWPLIEFAAEYELPLRFIELMPISMAEVLDERHFFSVGEVKSLIQNRARIEPDTARHGHGPAVYYRLPEHGVTVGFIGAITRPHFCATCNKMRLTADGKIRPCLGHPLEFDLKAALRPRINRHRLQELFLAALRDKPRDHRFRRQYQPERIMTALGG
jgi:cyclic pyranopterin phosphate synthase